MGSTATTGVSRVKSIADRRLVSHEDSLLDGSGPEIVRDSDNVPPVILEFQSGTSTPHSRRKDAGKPDRKRQMSTSKRCVNSVRKLTMPPGRNSTTATKMSP